MRRSGCFVSGEGLGKFLPGHRAEFRRGQDLGIGAKREDPAEELAQVAGADLDDAGAIGICLDRVELAVVASLDLWSDGRRETDRGVYGVIGFKIEDRGYGGGIVDVDRMLGGMGRKGGVFKKVDVEEPNSGLGIGLGEEVEATAMLDDLDGVDHIGTGDGIYGRAVDDG